jgi:hypothetical protein
MFDLCYTAQVDNKKSEVRKDAMGVYTIAFYMNDMFTHSSRSYVKEEAEKLADSFVGNSRPTFLSE